MGKRFIAWMLCMAILFSFAIAAVAMGYTSVEITVESAGNHYKEELLQNDKGILLVPVTWLSEYAYMAYAEEGSQYVYYYVGEEQNRIFAKRIFIDKNGKGAELACYISQSKYEVITSVEFSDSCNQNGTLYVPLEEFLPLFNAKTEITNDGILHINVNPVSLLSTLYHLDLDRLAFDAKNDMVGAKFISATSLLVDTVFNWRFDRLDGLYHSGEINDYNTLFKAYLTDDDVYLSAYDNNKTPEETYLEIISNGAKTFNDTSKQTTLIPKLLSYMYKSAEYPDIKALAENCSDFGDIMSVNAEAAKILYKMMSYYSAYTSQVEDHRNMLDAVYGGDYYRSSDPACQAADQTKRLYSEEADLRNKTIASEFVEYIGWDLVETAFVDEFALKPYKLATSVVKAVIPESMELFEDDALLYYMDEATKDACKVYERRVGNLSFEEQSLNDLRLTAMFALIASRHAYTTLWEEHSKLEDINTALEQLYLASDSVPMESRGYYEVEHASLCDDLYYITATIDPKQTMPVETEPAQTWPTKEELFNETVWYWITGTTLGNQRKVKTHLDGTFENDRGETGTYAYQNGVLTFDGVILNLMDDGSFVSAEEYYDYMSEENMHYTLHPTTKDAWDGYFPEETMPSQNATPGFFDGRCWMWAEGPTLAAQNVVRFYSDGTYEGYNIGSGMYINGTYSYSAGELTFNGEKYIIAPEEDVFAPAGGGDICIWPGGEEMWSQFAVADTPEQTSEESYIGTWLFEYTLPLGEEGGRVIITDDSITIKYPEGETLGPYSYTVVHDGQYTKLTFGTDWDEHGVAVCINQDMMGLYFEEYAYGDVCGTPSFGDTGSGRMMFRSGAETTDIELPDSYYQWFYDVKYEYMYYPNANVLYVWNAGDGYYPMYIYEDGTLEYMEAIALLNSNDLPSDAIYTNSNFVITDNK